MKIRPLALSLAAACLVAAPQIAHSFGSGAAATNCNGCHVLGTAPTVSLTGPTTVTGGTSNEYLFIITSPAGQLSGGLNASSLLGDLTTGGAESFLTTTSPSAAGGNNDVTHVTPKAGDGAEVRFSFLWEAPVAAGPATIDVWGNAVNANGSATGDQAAFTSLAITVEAAPPPPVPATSPWSQAGMTALLLGAGSLLVLRRRSSLS